MHQYGQGKYTIDRGEGHINILPWDYQSITQGTWISVTAAGIVLNGYMYNSSDAQNDQIDFKVYLSAGTYGIFEVVHVGPNRAIITFLVDGVSTGVLSDLYWGSYVSNILAVPGSFAVTTPGLKTFSLKAATRNASATGWAIAWTQVLLWRTA